MAYDVYSALRAIKSSFVLQLDVLNRTRDFAKIAVMSTESALVMALFLDTESRDYAHIWYLHLQRLV